MVQKSPFKKKSLGQHFLRDQYVIADAVKTLQRLNPHKQSVVEIGPGDGALTRGLLQTGYAVHAIELDPRWVEHLQTEFAEYISSGQLQICNADATQVDVADLGIVGEYHVVGNIPYYITGLLLRTWLTKNYQPQSLTLIMQREVAERIVAKDSKTSVLSTSVQVYGIPKLERIIKPGAFSPPPKVDSALLSVEEISRQKLIDTNVSDEAFFNIIKAAYAHKRKQVVSNLKGLFIKDVLLSIFETLDWVETIRAEDISIDEWVRFCSLVSGKKS